MTRPRLHTGINFVPGLAAVALFVVFAAVFLTTAFEAPVGFGENAAVMKSLGAAMFNLDPAPLVGDAAPVASEGFLLAFEIVDAVLVAALVGAVMLARREESGENVTVGTEAPGSAESPAATTDGGTPGGDDA